jgi:hypothetical protein
MLGHITDLLTRGRRLKSSRVAAKLLLIWAVLYPLLFVAFPAWQLRHSYKVWMIIAHHKAVLYPFARGRILKRNRAAVRKWVEADILDPVELPWAGRLSRTYDLLLHFGEREDLDILLRRAEMGFRSPPPLPDELPYWSHDVSDLENLSLDLVNKTYWLCQKLTDDDAQALTLLAEEYGRHTIAPEVGEAYEWLVERWETKQTAPTNQPVPSEGRIDTP